MMSNKNKNKNNRHTTPSLRQKNPSSQSITATHQRVEQYSGPIPHPDILYRYNQMVPDAAERIFVMAEKEAPHRHNLENKTLDVLSRQLRLGQILGFTMGIATLTITMVALVLGYENVAIALGSTTVIGLVAVFVTGRMVNNKN